MYCHMLSLPAGLPIFRYFVQLFSALKVLVHTRRTRGRKIALLSNGNGAAQLALDVMGDNESVYPAELSMASIKALTELLEPGSKAGKPENGRASCRARGCQDV